MKVKNYEMAQIKHSGSRGSTGFPSACFLFAVQYMLVSPAPLQRVQADGARTPQPALVGQPLARHQGDQIVVTAREQDRQGQGPCHLVSITFTNEKPLFSLSSLHLYLSLCSCLLLVDPSL